jgi:hypothetical protein
MSLLVPATPLRLNQAMRALQRRDLPEFDESIAKVLDSEGSMLRA